MADDWKLTDSERRIFQLVWQKGPIARVAITEHTGLASGSVTRITRDLQQRGLLHDEISRSGQRGQPARPLSLRPDGAFACGVNFSHSYLDVGLLDLAGTLVGSERMALEKADPRSIAGGAREGLFRLVEATGIPLAKIVGAGFSVPGDFGESRDKFKAHAYFPALLDHDLVAEFGDAMPVKVFVENDGASAALGERVNGAGRPLDSFAFIHIGHGVGGALIIGGRLHRGAHGNAGVVGMLYPMNQPRPSGQDLLEYLHWSKVPVTDFDQLDSITPDDCPPLARWIARAGEQLGTALHVAGRFVDPDAVILGGRLPPHLVRALLEAVDIPRAFAESRAIPIPPIIPSQLGPYAGVIGAASVCFFETFFDGPSN